VVHSCLAWMTCHRFPWLCTFVCHLLNSHPKSQLSLPYSFQYSSQQSSPSFPSCQQSCPSSCQSFCQPWHQLCCLNLGEPSLVCP
jgi:hypothetical protein